MRKKIIVRTSIFMFVSSFCFVFFISAGENILSPMEQKVKTIVIKAHQFVSDHSNDLELVQKAFENDPRFRDDENDLYIFMHAYNTEKKEAVCIVQGARPALIGKNMWALRTPNGRLLFQEEIELIQKHDEYWLTYEWLNPYTSTIQIKTSFFKRIVLKDGRNAWIGCGFWQQDTNHDHQK